MVDNLEEIERLSRLAGERGVTQEVLLRVAPGVEAHTHAHIQTGALDTKFGLSHPDGRRRRSASRVLKARRGCELVGLHAHIGSQIFELEPYRETIARVFELRQLRTARFELRELSPGGGFGMRYTPADEILGDRRRHAGDRGRRVRRGARGSGRGAAAG